MSDEPDDTTDGTTDDTTAAARPASPRPRSTTSRARRIGGAAVSRPDTEAGTGSADRPTVAEADTAAAEPDKATKAEKPTKAARTARTARTAKAEKPATAAKVAGTAAAAGEDDEASAEHRPSGSVTVSLPGWLRWVPGFAFAAVAVVFLTLFIVARLGNDAASTTSSDERQKVLAAAKNCLATLNTYSYTKLDAAEAAGVKCTTGKLTSDYRKTVTNVIKQNAPRLKATQLAKITTAGIESVTKNGKQWTVLAYGQLNITTANQKQGRIDPFAVVARLQQVDGKWVLSKVDTVSSFSS